MHVEFANKTLREFYEDWKKVRRKWGNVVARKYVERINIIKSVRDFEELQLLPGLGVHKLIGDRKGSWSMKLTGQHRLIFSIQQEQFEIVLVEEVSKHYDG